VTGQGVRARVLRKEATPLSRGREDATPLFGEKSDAKISRAVVERAMADRGMADPIDQQIHFVCLRRVIEQAHRT
jgi:hypothetical protein